MGFTSMEPVFQDSVIGLIKKIQQRKISVTELVSSCLKQIAKVNKKINAVVVNKEESALKKAKEYDALLEKGKPVGALHGIPFTAKDIYETKGDPTTAGSLGLKNNIPKKDAVLVERLLKAGAILLGKTNTPELESAVYTDNLVYGKTNNPYNIEYSSGGSSGGSAASVASCCSAFDVGSDTGGSLRIPAHYCGIATVRPTLNRIPSTGVVYGLRTGAMGAMTTEGPLARSVLDLPLLLEVLQGPDQNDPRILDIPLHKMKKVNLKREKIAYFFDNGSLSPNKKTVEAIKNSVQVLAHAGSKIEHTMPSCFMRGNEIFLEIMGADGSRAFEKALQELKSKPSFAISKVIEYLKPYACDMKTFSARWHKWDLFRSEMLQFFTGYDLVICPVTPYSALSNKVAEEKGNFELLTYIWTVSAMLMPTVVVRAGTDTNGLPIGVQIIAKPGCEHKAFAAACELEKSLGGWQYPKSLET